MTLLRMRGIRKRFGDAEVLKSVDFEVSAGEIRALVGQNGAGKSSLMKVLSGVYAPDAGSILVDDVDVRIDSPSDAHAAGIRMVFQEFSLIPGMNASQNVVLSQERTRFGLTNDRAERDIALALFERLGVDIDPDRPVRELRVADRQMVEIAKALSRDPKVLVLDEPTAALSREEAERLFAVVRRLREGGLGIVFISHHMQEVIEICDSVTVMRDGLVVATLDAEEMTVDSVVSAMLPPDAVQSETERPSTERGDEAVLELRDAFSGSRVRGMTLSLFPGEIVGLAGLAGSGPGELLEMLFGLRDVDGGAVSIDGKAYEPVNPSSAIQRGVMLISEDRRTTGIIGGHSVAWNMLQAVWRRFARWGFIDDRAGRGVVAGFIDRLKIRAANMDVPIQLLSGGNQQKVLVARALLVKPRILLLSEPTAGIDIRARADITAAVRDYVATGGSAIWVSADLRELSESCDRVLVVRHGRIVDEFVDATEATLATAIQLESA